MFFHKSDKNTIWLEPVTTKNSKCHPEPFLAEHATIYLNNKVCRDWTTVDLDDQHIWRNHNSTAVEGIVDAVFINSDGTIASIPRVSFETPPVEPDPPLDKDNTQDYIQRRIRTIRGALESFKDSELPLETLVQTKCGCGNLHERYIWQGSRVVYWQSKTWILQCAFTSAVQQLNKYKVQNAPVGAFG